MVPFAFSHVGALAKRSLARWVRSSHGASHATKRVAIPGYFLQWLGISPQSFADACSRRGLRTFSFVDTPGNGTQRQRGEDLLCPPELEDAVTYATCVEADSLPSELGSSHRDLQRQWRQVMAVRFAAVLDLFVRHQPSVVLLLQGFEPHNAVARAAALRLGIPFVALENTALAHRIVWDNVSGITTNRSLAKNYFWRFKDRVDAETCRTYCAQLIGETRRLKSDEHKSPAGGSRYSPRRPTVLFLGQVYTDASQVFGLRQWTSPLAILQECVRWCREWEYDLVVKLHPKETCGINTINGRPYNQLTFRKIMQSRHLADGLTHLQALVDQDNAYDTYELIEQCRMAVTVNSQAGLEAAIRGKPVVACGETFYGGLEITCDAPGPAYFDGAMREATTCRPGRGGAAQQFAYVFFEKYCREKKAETLVQLVEENLL